MSVDSREERRRQAAEQAAHWLLVLQSDEASTTERGEFVDWLRESPIHVGEMLRICCAHNALSLFSGWAEIPPLELRPEDHVVRLDVPVQRQEEGEATATRTRTTWVRWRFAAVAAVIAIGGVFLAQVFGETVIRTERGERREITLADGSVVDLAPQSTLRVRLRTAERRLRLDRGEAYFLVSADPRRPFIVEASQTRVVAVGTAFNVQHGDDGIVVTVVEGKVSVSEETALLDRLRGGVPAARIQIPVRVNEQMTVQSDGRATPVRAVNAEAEIAWTTGRLIFENEPLAVVVDRFNRYNKTKIRIADPAFAARRVSGVFRASDPSSFIELIENVAGGKVVRQDGEIVVFADAQSGATTQ